MFCYLQEATMVVNKKVSCKICSKVIGSDNLSRNMKKHKNPSLKDPEQICKSILEDIINDIPYKKTSKDETSIYSEKRKVNYLHSDGLDESTLSGDEIDDKELRKRLAHDDYHYTKKPKLGAKVAKLIKENGYHPDSLRSEYKEALDLHLKKRMMNSFPENIEFKP